MIPIYSCGTAPRHSERRTLFFDLPSLLSAIILLVALFHSDMLIFYRTFAAQRFVRHLCISKAGTFLSIHFSIFFSRETTFLTSAFGGLRESHTLSLHLRARFFFKKKEKEKKRKKKKETCLQMICFLFTTAPLWSRRPVALHSVPYPHQ